MSRPVRRKFCDCVVRRGMRDLDKRERQVLTPE